MKLHLIAGARPNFVKIAPLVPYLRNAGWVPYLVHSGQHFDDRMSSDFFDDLNLPKPDFHLGRATGSHAQQTAHVMQAYEELFLSEKPELVVVPGDVNASLACAIAAKKCGGRVAHLEAGLRCGDTQMPEEINRRIIDSISDYLWAPSQDAVENLLREGRDNASIKLVGNIMIDALIMMRPALARRQILRTHNLTSGGYILATLHRPANVDNVEVLRLIIQQLAELSTRMPVIFPAHPRTKKVLESMDCAYSATKSIKMMHAERYLDFVHLQQHSRMVITDSGGVQEETSYLGVPCLTVRPSTERPITLEYTNRLVSPEDIYSTSCQILDEPSPEAKAIPFWDGNTAKRIADCLEMLSHRPGINIF